MQSTETPTSEQPPRGLAEISVIAFFVISMVGWLLGCPLVLQALSVFAEPKLSDAAIGGFVVAMGTFAIGVPMFLLSLLLAAFARRLPRAFRIVSLLPGLAAVLAGSTMLVLAYSK